MCPTDPQVLRGGAAGGWPCPALARSGDLGGSPCAGGRALAPAPSHLRHRVPPGRGLAAAPHGGATTAETPVCLRPQNLPSHLLCAHVCECVKLRATVCTGASRVPEQGAVPRGHLSQGGGFGSTRGVSVRRHPPPLPKKVRGRAPWELRLAPPRRAGLCGHSAAGQEASLPPQALRGPRETPRVRPRQPRGEAKTPGGIPAPLTVTPHAQQ